MKKRIVSLLMAVLMLVTMLPVTAMAEELTTTAPSEEQVVSGETTPAPAEEPETPAEPEEPAQPEQPEEPARPEMLNQPEQLTVNNSGEYEYTTDDITGDATITKYNGSAWGLVIPSTLDGHTVVAISNEAFKEKTSLRSVTIPDTITKIGRATFWGCVNLATVNLPSALVTLEGWAFAGCTSLTEIWIPKSLTTVDNITAGFAGDGGPFKNCSSLSKITFEEGIRAIPNNLFLGWTGGTEITIPETVTRIGNRAFDGSKLKTIVFSSNLTEIGDSAFAGTPLVSVDIPDTVTKIEKCAFINCVDLSNVKLSSSLTVLEGWAFANCTSLEEILIPKALTTVNNITYGFSGDGGPFKNCSSLSKITFEEGIKEIPSCLFFGWTGGTEITIPETVIKIGSKAFEGSKLKAVTLPSKLTVIDGAAFANTPLTAIDIPDTVTTIGSWAFSGCKNLADVKLSKNLLVLKGWAFADCTSLKEIWIPKTLTTVDDLQAGFSGEGGPFKGCDNLSSVVFEDGITVIPNDLFLHCTGALKLQFPASVKIIGRRAFGSCTNIKEITLPAELTEIKNDVFEYSSLESIVIPNSVTKLGTAVFKNCRSLKTAVLPDTYTCIPYSTFEECTALESIILPDTVITIQEKAFKNCASLKEVVWNTALTEIQSQAFYGCKLLKTLDWSKTSVTSIGYEAFRECSALRQVDVPTTVNTVSDRAFRDCDALATVTIPDSVTSIGTQVFYDCDALTSVKLGSGITTIPESTFEHCDALESIVIPRRVTTIGNNAFKNCVKFTSITIPRSVTNISSNVFSYPAKMTIYGVAGTYAETFANANNIKFVDKRVNATAVTLSSKELTLSKGASATLFLTVTPEDFTDEVSWKSGNTSVVTVNDAGVVKAVGLGTATIKVMVGDASASCKITVQQPVTDISLNKTSLTLDALDTFQLTANARPDTALDRRVSWSSSAPDIASVDETGLVTAHKKGSAVITASAMDGSGVTRTCTVTVSNTAYICTTVEEMESPHKYSNNCTDFWVYTISGAEKLRVTFDARTNIEEDFDYLYIFDGTGKQAGKYTGTELAGQTITVPGDTVKLKLASDDAGSEWGFKVSRITSGTASGTVTGNVTTEGNAADPVTIAFKQNGSIVKTATVSDGSYRVSGLTDGSYTLEASKPGCVPRSYSVIVKDGEVVSSPDVVLVAVGNINGVSVRGEDVEITDVACLYTFMTTRDRSQSNIDDEAYFLAVADVNGDGSVDVYDLQLLYETVSGIA